MENKLGGWGTTDGGGLEVRKGAPHAANSTKLWLETSVLPAKESQKSWRSYSFKYKCTDVFSKHNTLSIDRLRG